MSEDDQKILGELFYQHQQGKQQLACCAAKAEKFRIPVVSILDAIEGGKTVPNPRPAWPTPEEIGDLCKKYGEALALVATTERRLAELGYEHYLPARKE